MNIAHIVVAEHLIEVVHQFDCVRGQSGKAAEEQIEIRGNRANDRVMLSLWQRLLFGGDLRLFEIDVEETGDALQTQ